MNYSRGTIVSSLFIKFIEQLSVKLTSLIVSIVLARILEVSDFGLIAILTIFVHISSSIIEGGLSTSLIQKKDVRDVDYSTVFYSSLGLAVLLYVLLFASADFIADQYHNQDLSLYLRIIGLTLFVTPFNTVQFGYIYKHMQFKKMLIATLTSSAVSGVTGIVMAYNGYGAWSLVVQTMLNSIITVLMLLFLVKWKPKPLFSFVKLKEHFAYGWKLLVSSLLETFYNEVRSLVIGKKYTADDLAYYNRGDSYPKTVMTSLNTSVQTVMFPVLSSEQENRLRLKEVMRKSIALSSFIVFPVMAGFAAVADPVIRIILTEKWLPCVPYLQLACIIYAIQPINSCNLQAIKAIGRSDLYLILDIIKIGIGLLILAIAAFKFNSPMAIAVATAIYAPFQLMINAVPNQRLIDYSLKEQFQDIATPFALAILMFGVVHLLGLFNIQIWVKLVLQIFVGIIVYIGLAYIFKVPALREIKGRFTIQK